MTILPFVRPETTFDPDAVAIMSSAFDAALASLNDQNQSPTRLSMSIPTKRLSIPP